MLRFLALAALLSRHSTHVMTLLNLLGLSMRRKPPSSELQLACPSVHPAQSALCSSRSHPPPKNLPIRTSLQEDLPFQPPLPVSAKGCPRRRSEPRSEISLQALA
uniref:Secreted protein n=1 Tax=Cryptococcus bacillisporus CA1280 TaxID=1296109 RepID=A0A0D0VMW2_CRYGA|nr:hypothetical protein I312_01705 [Cryptococcus bacillisporus CA1280]